LGSNAEKPKGLMSPEKVDLHIVTPSGSEFHFQGSALTQRRCLLLLPPASINAIAAPLLLLLQLLLPSPCRRHCRIAIAAPQPSPPQSQAGGN
jgi:hypothetical protein